MVASVDEKSKLLSSSSSHVHKEPNLLNGLEFQVYRRRWFMLVVVFLLNLTNGMVFITFSPVADTTVLYYNITPFKVNILAVVFPAVSVPIGFVATWLLDTKGLRLSLIMAGWLNGVGSFLRNVSTFDSIPLHSRYTWCLSGQILAACAQPFIMFAPTKLAAVWFAGNERAKANMMGSMANPLGYLIGNLLAPNVVQSQKDIPLLLWIITGPSILAMSMVTFGVCSSVPPTPPTSSAEEQSEPFFKGLKQLLKNKRYWFLNYVNGTALGLFTAYSSFFDQILCPRGYTDTFAGLCGALMIGMGSIGSVFASFYADKTKRFEEVVKVCWCLCVLFTVVFSQIARFRNQQVLVALFTGLFGCFGFAILPICMELAVETTYPVAEATSAGFNIISGQLQGIVYILLMQFMAQDLSQEELDKGTGCEEKTTSANHFVPKDWTVPLLFASAIAVFSLLILMCFFKAEYRRMNAEQRTAAEKIASLNVEIPAPEL